jgi:hypothetical protein
MITIIDSLDIAPILKEYFQLEKSIAWTEYQQKGKQTGLQYKPGEDPFSSSVGKRKDGDSLYREINPLFIGTIFESLLIKYKCTRSRLMWINPMSCYSMHKDETYRIQIPLITNPDCYFLFKHSTPIHLTSGYVYHADTRNIHTFINCSEYPRLHFVGCTTDSIDYYKNNKC